MLHSTHGVKENQQKHETLLFENNQCVSKISVSVHRFRVQRSGLGLGKRLKLDPRNPRKKCGCYHIIAK